MGSATENLGIMVMQLIYIVQNGIKIGVYEKICAIWHDQHRR